MMRMILAALALLAFVPGALAQTGGWRVDAAASEIAFSGTHAGAEFSGRFGEWSAEIAFDPENLAAAKARVVIDSASARTGDRFQETTLAQAEWFDARKHPEIVFETQRIDRITPTRFLAQGALTVKGKAVPLALPFNLTLEGGRAQMQAELTLSRAALNLGMESDPGGEWVSAQIPVRIRVSATRAP